jgi:hypothetical protein
MSKFETMPAGEIALIQQQGDGRILQIAMNKDQHRMLKIFLATISNESPLVQMGEEHDLILKSSVCKRCKTK